MTLLMCSHVFSLALQKKSYFKANKNKMLSLQILLSNLVLLKLYQIKKSSWYHLEETDLQDKMFLQIF